MFKLKTHLETPKVAENTDDPQVMQNCINWSMSTQFDSQEPTRRCLRPFNFPSSKPNPEITKTEYKNAVGTASKKTSIAPIWRKWLIFS